MIESMLVLSTAHLTEYTCNVRLHEHKGDYPIYEKGEVGWFIYVFDDDVLDFPIDLEACLHFARHNKCQWVMFDCDAPTIDELPTFEW